MSILPWIKYKDIKCKECIYYSGVHCKGHGEYYGSCKITSQIYKMLEIAMDMDLSTDKLPEYLNDDSICPFVKQNIGYNKDYDK